MLKPYKIADYISEYKPEWACAMPDGCPPEDVLVAEAHPFSTLISRMGWHATSIGKKLRKIAAL